MKVLLTGSSGQLGREIIKSKPMSYEIIESNRSVLNLRNPVSCKNYVLANKPDFLINCAAYTDVEKAESEKELANLINAKSVKYLAESMRQINGNFIQLSTDYVFDGRKKMPYFPEDSKKPLNIYGKTKSIAEDFIRDIFKDSQKGKIIRTSWLMGSVGNNFALKMLKLFSQRDEINVINDQIAAPTTTKTLALACWKTIDLIDSGFVLPNILHYTNSGQASWYEIANKIFKTGKKLNLLESNPKIKPVTSIEFPTKAIRPSYSVLDSSNSFKSISFKSDYWEDAIESLLLEFKNNLT